MKTEITKIHYDKTAKVPKILSFASIFYAMAIRLRNQLYDMQILKSQKVNAFVISVGNLTTGGVGKTPIVAEIAKYYTKTGKKVAIISRGYGGKLSNKNTNVISNEKEVFFPADLAGDEPFWLANQGFTVITGKNRVKSANYAIENLGAQIIILDDGFQHRKIHRNLDLVLIDSEKVFGNEKILPAGPLREATEAFKRIDKLIVVSKSTDHTRAQKFAKIMGKKLKKDAYVAKTEPDFCYNLITKEKFEPQNEKFIAISAIAQPKQFYNFLKDFDIIKTIDFDDHHNYTQEDVENLKKQEIHNIITTEKDAVKLAQLDLNGLNIFVLKLKVNLDWNTLFDDWMDF